MSGTAMFLVMWLHDKTLKQEREKRRKSTVFSNMVNLKWMFLLRLTVSVFNLFSINLKGKTYKYKIGQIK